MKQDESKIKKVLVLGAGYVTAGLINVLSQDSDTHITIALQLLEEAEKFASIANIGNAVELNILENIPRTMELIQTHEVVISILRQFFHTNWRSKYQIQKKHAHCVIDQGRDESADIK